MPARVTSACAPRSRACSASPASSGGARNACRVSPWTSASLPDADTSASLIACSAIVLQSEVAGSTVSSSRVTTSVSGRQRYRLYVAHADSSAVRAWISASRALASETSAASSSLRMARPCSRRFRTSLANEVSCSTLLRATSRFFWRRRTPT